MDANKLTTVELKNITMNDPFWNRYIDLVDQVILPFQWELINDHVEGAEKSYCIRNFRIACGDEKGEHKGMVFQDTDVAKWLEATAYSLAKKKNPKLEAAADSAIDLIARAQCEDGYLNTYYTITGKPRWSDLFEGHELYTAGHMIEAAVAYYEATGKKKFLDVVCRFADYMCQVFGKEEGKIHGYPGHPEVELALVKLYRVTKVTKYLELADFFVRTRGERPCYFLGEDCIKNQDFIFPEFKDFDLDYNQSHMPLKEQKTAEGHAVRAVYLYSAMADLAYEYQDKELLRQCETIWNNIVEKRMYVTGSIGSASYGERFTTDYDLPNNSNYSESCATVGLAMFSNRMFRLTKDGKYTDIVEKALYNTLLAGIALDGKHFFYVNPLEVVPEIAEKNPTLRHVKTARQLWFGVACCPPNIARTLASLGNYLYAADQNTVYVNLFISSRIETDLSSGRVRLDLSSDYPVKGDVTFEVTPEEDGREFTVAIRKPSYSPGAELSINGVKEAICMEKGYIYLTRKWKAGDKVTAVFDVPFRFVRCNPRVRDNIGKICLMKGPMVYCLEEADNGKYLAADVIDSSVQPKEVFDESLLGGTLCAELEGMRIDYSRVSESLYENESPSYINDTFKAIPYCCWNNRGKGEMLVWMREK
ncbi:glycoside hydrolase family 127 protein [Clostridium sp. Marseille-P2415]|uniref:glycoside hydrolase family 127 protein n=1 Tax=Clostridium sp. Marseille-P2415 TaxID=1805471 RepID=UPI0009887C8B|nr:beta-L-arabinofuranosidase domain-containing protein [Clostridium sp. Marseille-P2415]